MIPQAHLFAHIAQRQLLVLVLSRVACNTSFVALAEISALLSFARSQA